MDEIAQVLVGALQLYLDRAPDDREENISPPICRRQLLDRVAASSSKAWVQLLMDMRVFAGRGKTPIIPAHA